MPRLEDVDVVAEILGWLATHPDVVAGFPGTPSGVAEAPWPHLMVSGTSAGDLGDLRWSHTSEVQLEVLGSPDGAPGPAALTRLLKIAARCAAEIVNKPYTAGDTVVSRVESSGGVVNRPGPEGQPRLLTTLRVTAHPGVG